MKLVVGFLFSLVFVPCSFVYGQSDSTNRSAPQLNDSTNIMKEDRVEVQFDKLPPKMQDELRNDGKYKGWETGNFFLERNTDQYLIHIQSTTGTKTFRFDKAGVPLRTSQIPTSGEKN